MSNKTYEHNNLEFDIVKRDDVVTITCIDKVMHKSYQETFTREYIIDRLSLNNLNNFYNIICHSFDNNTIIIMVLRDKIELSINTEIKPVLFQFDISLFLMNCVEMNETTIYIEKLEKRIRELEENMIVPICRNCSDYSYVFTHKFIDNLKIECYSVFDVKKLYCINSFVELLRYNFETRELYILIRNCSNFSLNTSFKTLKTKMIEFVGSVKQLTDEQLLHFPQLIN